jgi:hypothetical protein
MGRMTHSFLLRAVAQPVPKITKRTQGLQSWCAKARKAKQIGFNRGLPRAEVTFVALCAFIFVQRRQLNFFGRFPVRPTAIAATEGIHAKCCSVLQPPIPTKRLLAADEPRMARRRVGREHEPRAQCHRAGPWPYRPRRSSSAGRLAPTREQTRSLMGV